jgi:preprotein translocase subunit SecY
MLQTILNSFSVPEIRKKLMFTAAILALYRLGAYIPAGVDPHVKDGLRRRRSTSSLPQPFSGGSLAPPSSRLGSPT